MMAFIVSASVWLNKFLLKPCFGRSLEIIFGSVGNLLLCGQMVLEILFFWPKVLFIW